MSEDQVISSVNRSADSYEDVPINFSDPWPAVRDDLMAYDNLISKTGILFEHWVALPYPIGDTQIGGIRSYGSQKVADNRGYIVANNFIYKKAGVVFGVFQNAPKNLAQLPVGYYGDSVAYVTFNKFYKGSTQVVSLGEWDKLIPCESAEEIFSVNWQKIIHNPTGIDKLNFLATHIEWVMDSTGREYIEGQDYVLEEGCLKWLSSGQRPGIDPDSNQGRVTAVRYRYKPFFYVKSMIHELRIHATIDPMSQEIAAKRSPVQAAVQVDYIFLAANKNQESAQANAAPEAPTGGNVGPR